MGIHQIKVPKCYDGCPYDDPKRYAGFVMLKNRVFEWYCCPSVGCLHIGEWPERRTPSTEEELIFELTALKLLAKILKGERPWRDLAEVERLMPPAAD